MYKYVLAIDPGVTTGYCWSYINYEEKEIHILTVGEFNRWSRIEEFLSVIDNTNTCIVYEGFRFALNLRNNVRAGACTNSPSEVIGVIRFLADKFNIQVYEQLPHERKVVLKWYNEMLHRFPSHYGDATQHNILQCYKLMGNKLGTLVYDYKELLLNLDSCISY